MRKHSVLTVILLTLSLGPGVFLSHAQDRAPYCEELSEWTFSKPSEGPLPVTLPHSYNALDGHSGSYYRGEATYTKELEFSSVDLRNRKYFLLLEGAAQKATIYVDDKEISRHEGGYTAFCVPLSGNIHEGRNVLRVVCDNSEDVDLAPVTSDFNKNGGLHNPAFLLGMGKFYFCPMENGPYRLHVSTPSVSAEKAQARVQTRVVNSSAKPRKMTVRVELRDDMGKKVASRRVKVSVPAGGSAPLSCTLDVDSPHLWNGVEDPYLYTVTLKLRRSLFTLWDYASVKTAFRFFSMDLDKGFFLNGRPYPLRGVSIHQDTELKATALSPEDYIRDYGMVMDMGANFVRLAHYPHNDIAFSICDSLGLLVQTEIPWVNICGKNATQKYFDNLHSQAGEMVRNLFNHPSVVFWGMWNELDTWGNNDRIQGPLDEGRVVAETARLYDYIKSLDGGRFVGLTDDSVLARDGYTSLKADYISENRYNGWYYGTPAGFRGDLDRMHSYGRPFNISEYGVGVNPFCHTWREEDMTKRGNDTKHFEEYGNYFHEEHYRMIMQDPSIVFTSLWVMFDFPVSGRQEGFLDSDDGVNFTRNESRLYTNDKGIVTRDREVKKDSYYFYRSLWNTHDKTLYITSRRLEKIPRGQPYTIKVYSNAGPLTLLRDGKEVQTLSSPTDPVTGVIWCFDPQVIEGEGATFEVRNSDGSLTDSVKLSTFEQ